MDSIVTMSAYTIIVSFDQRKQVRSMRSMRSMRGGFIIRRLLYEHNLQARLETSPTKCTRNHTYRQATSLQKQLIFSNEHIHTIHIYTHVYTNMRTLSTYAERTAQNAC
jgi:hypothetical protein